MKKSQSKVSVKKHVKNLDFRVGENSDSHLGCAKKASYLARVKALVIDLFMLYMPILYIMTYFVIGSAAEFRESDLYVFASWNLYGIICALMIANLGQTPGMRALGLRLVRKNGAGLGFVAVFGRFLLFILSACLFCGVAIPFIREARTTLHDWILGTVMVECDAQSTD